MIVLPSAEQVTALSNRSWPVPLYGPAYCELPSSSFGMSSIEIAYVGPSVMMSVAKVRETPYLMSAQVIGVAGLERRRRHAG